MSSNLMIKKWLSLAFLLIGLLFKGYSSSSVNEIKVDSDVLAYLDSVYFYEFKDLEKSQHFLGLCDSLLSSKTIISNSLKSEIVLLKMSAAINADNILGAFKIFEEYNAFAEEGTITSQLLYYEAHVLFMLGQFEDAQQKFYSLIDNVSVVENPSLHCSAYYSLGNLAKSTGDLKEAVRLQQQSIKISKKYLPEDVGLAQDYCLLAGYKYDQEKYEEALGFCERSLVLESEFGNTSLRCDLLILKSKIFLKYKDFKEAKVNIDSAKVILQKLKSPIQNVKYALTLADYHYYQQEFNLAVKRIEAIDVENISDLDLQKEYYNNFYKAALASNQTSKAIANLEKVIQVSDTITSKSNQRTLAYSKIKFETAQQQNENKKLAGELKDVRMRQALILVIAGLLFTGFIFVFYLFRQKQSYSKKLADEVQKRTVELNTSNIKLSKSIQELEHFNFILSHDLKEPVRNIVSFSGLAKRQLSNNDEVKDYFGYIENSGKQLNSLLQDVLSFHKIGLVSNFELAPICLTSLIANIKSFFLEEKEEQRISINTKNLSFVNSNVKLLKHVLKNLIENGIKYNQNKHIQINISQESDSEFDKIYIEDNGIGIEAHYFDQVFVMFKRLNNREKYQGSGLGLSISKKLMEKMSGDVFIESSTLGKGTIFCIQIPKSILTTVPSNLVSSLEN